MMPISRRYAGTSVIRWPSTAISPLSGIKKPATRLSSVVLPQPDGPSSVISSPRRISSETSSSAVILPKRLVTPSSWTAISAPPFACVAGVTAAAESLPSAGRLNVEHLCKAKEDIGQRQQRRGDHNVHDRDRRHRGVGVFAHVVVERNRQRLRALRRDEQRSGKFVERQDCREQPAADQARKQQRQGDGGENAVGRRTEARGSELQSRIEVAQRDVDAPQH